MGDIDYIEPNQIGCIELSKKERMIIMKSEHIYIRYFLLIIYIAFILFESIHWLKTDGLNEQSIQGIIVGSGVIIFLLSNKYKIRFTASAHGKVVQKDIIKQRVIAGKKYRYKRYIADPVHTDRPTVEQEFYYLTLQLNDGRYVRYVNCLRDDFVSVSEGDTVLAVCYGFNEIKGYVI